MQTYLNFLQHILDHGVAKQDRTGVGTRSVFDYTMRFDLREGLPVVTTKRVHLKSVIAELLWFVHGSTNVKPLQEQGVRIWNAWADEHGELGPVYGKQWRAWQTADGRTVDQLANLVHDLRENPDSRRHILTAWNVGELDRMALPPCHMLCQFYVAEGRLSCKLTQRSADAFLGVPFNIVSYSLLTHMLAQQCDLTPHLFVWSGGDCHVYDNHMAQVTTQLQRTPYPLPSFRFARRPNSIDDYTPEDFIVEGYEHHPTITAPIAV